MMMMIAVNKFSLSVHERVDRFTGLLHYQVYRVQVLRRGGCYKSVKFWTRGRRGIQTSRNVRTSFIYDPLFKLQICKCAKAYSIR